MSPEAQTAVLYAGEELGYKDVRAEKEFRKGDDAMVLIHTEDRDFALALHYGMGGWEVTDECSEEDYYRNSPVS